VIIGGPPWAFASRPHQRQIKSKTATPSRKIRREHKPVGCRRLLSNTQFFLFASTFVSANIFIKMNRIRTKKRSSIAPLRIAKLAGSFTAHATNEKRATNDCAGFAFSSLSSWQD
jgi:hypothetical protein